MKLYTTVTNISYECIFITICILDTKIAAVQNMGIKAIAQLYYDAIKPDLMIVTNSTSRRAKFVKSILDIVESRNMDGFFLAWKFPQCVMVKALLIYIFCFKILTLLEKCALL
jgi:hypothetical protein